MAWPNQGPDTKREITNVLDLRPSREIAASLAARFVTALLFVSAAVGPLPIA